jgi:hypothetical protein
MKSQGNDKIDYPFNFWMASKYKGIFYQSVQFRVLLYLFFITKKKLFVNLIYKYNLC